METLRAFGYLVAAVVVVGVLASFGAFVMAVVTAVGFALCVLTVIAFVAACFKEYFEK